MEDPLVAYHLELGPANALACLQCNFMLREPHHGSVFARDFVKIIVHIMPTNDRVGRGFNPDVPLTKGLHHYRTGVLSKPQFSWRMTRVEFVQLRVEVLVYSACS